MDASQDKGGSDNTLLIGLVLLLGLGALFAAVVPVVTCPDCPEPQSAEITINWSPCPRCKDRKKVPLFNRWFKESTLPKH